MSTPKQHSSLFPPPFPVRPFKKVVILDDDEIDTWIQKAILTATCIAKNIQLENSPLDFLKSLSEVDRLSEIPELIFIDANSPIIKTTGFIERFNHLSDFIRKKCKLVVVTHSSDEINSTTVPINSDIIKYIIKPLDVYHLRNLI